MNTLRTDEQASISNIENSRQFDDNIKRGVKTAANIGLGVGGVGIASKVMPFLNKYISPEIAIKGISKVSPKLGQFLQRGMAQGLNIQEGLDFLKDKINISQAEQEKSQSKAEEGEIEKLYDLAQKGKTAGNEFLKLSSKLVKNGSINDLDTFKNFYKWWKATGAQPHKSPLAAFEMFRRQIGDTLAEGAQQDQSKAALQGQPQPNAQSNTDEALVAALQKILQM